MIYANLVKANNKSKELGISRNLRREKDGKLPENICGRIEKINGIFYYINDFVNVELSTINWLYMSVFCNGYYISNISVLRNTKVLSQYCITMNTLSKIKDVSENFFNSSVYFLLKPKKDIRNIISRFVLKGYKYFCIESVLNILVNEENIYVLSQIPLIVMNDCSFQHFNCKKLYINSFDTTELTSMSCWFYGNCNLEEIYLDNFDTSNVKTMTALFQLCTNLRKVNIDILNTAKCTSFADMFAGCKSLKKLDLSHFNTGQVRNIAGMFCNCTELEELDLRGWTLKGVQGVSFYRCLFENTNIKNIIVDNIFSNIINDLEKYIREYNVVITSNGK